MNVNFKIDKEGQLVTATTAGTARAVVNKFNKDVIIYNPGPTIVHVLAGDSTVTATDLCMPVVAGEKWAYGKGSATHIAVKSETGTQNVYIFDGEGA